MKLLDGRELADYIMERQIRQVRALRQAWGVFPKLAIITTTEDQVISAYVRMKQAYGADILVDVDIHAINQADAITTIEQLNLDESVHGIIVQLPLAQPEETDKILATIAPEKDVDGLGDEAHYTSATATAIDWLLAGYNVNLKEKRIAIVGQGRLVGKPLAELWETTGYDISVYDDTVEDLQGELRKAQVIVTGTGVPGLITEHMIQPSAVIVDAGTATENGKIVGDVAAEVRTREDITITPEKGGVGPLTVAALFDNVITAAKKVAESLEEN